MTIKCRSCFGNSKEIYKTKPIPEYIWPKKSFLSIKSKVKDESDSRYPVIKQTNNVISCFTGKIQGIYIIEDYILKLINDDK